MTEEGKGHLRMLHLGFYYGASAVGGQDELNTVLWLATQAGRKDGVIST